MPLFFLNTEIEFSFFCYFFPLLLFFPATFFPAAFWNDFLKLKANEEDTWKKCSNDKTSLSQ